MRSIASKWFETKVKYDKMMEDGTQKPVPETYVVVKGIAEASYKEIFFSDLDTADKWYKAKLQFITLDEKTEKEKRTSVYYLVQAANFMQAVKNIDEVMGGTMIDYVIASVAETSIMDVFEHTAKKEG